MTTDHRSNKLAAIRVIVFMGITALIVWPIGISNTSANISIEEANGVDVGYTLTIDDPTSGQATVAMTVSGLSTDILEVEESGYHGLYVYVLELSAHDTDGNPLTVEHLPDSGTTWHGQRADVWQVQCSGLSQIVIEYTVQPGLAGAERGHIASDFAALSGESVFLVPRSHTSDSVTVSFNLPTGWNIHTPWAQQENTYDPAIPGASAIGSLSISAFALGQFDVYTQTIGSTEVAIAAYRDWSGNMKEELAKKSWDILAYQTAVFDASVGDYYLMFFCPPRLDGQPIAPAAWSTSSGHSVEFRADGSHWVDWESFAHAAFHRWNGWAWGMDGYHRWFGEGPNIFYVMKATTRLSLITYGNIEEALQYYYDTYLNEYVATGNDQALTSDSSDPFFDYTKAPMVAFLIAKEIYLRTDGEHNFDDFLQVLFQKYGHYAAPCSEECLKAELATLTGTEFGQFFDDYVYGTTTLPMDWAFEDSDDDGLSNALEIGWDTHPEDEDTDDDGYSDAVEIAGHSDPLDPSSIPHLVYLPVLAKD